MKVLLINPPYDGNINTWTPESTNKAIGTQPPMGIAYIASMLEKEKIDAAILDANALGIGKEGIREAIRRERPDIIGITAMTLISINAVAVSRIAKEASNAVTVIGGPHVTLFQSETLEDRSVDYAMDGESEYSFLEFARAIGSNSPVEGIEGLVYRKGNGVAANKIAVVDDLDSLPFPAVHLLPNDRYSLVNAKNPFGSIVTSRGCPFKCSFCIRGPIDKFVRFRDPRNVVDEIEYLIKDFNVKEINIRNDTVTLKRSHIMGICEELLRRDINIRWQGPTRVDCVDREMLFLMKRAGCHTLRYGIESGNQDTLDRMGKGTTLKQIRDAVGWTKEAGMEIMAYFMVGYIDETEAAIMDTINFAREINPDGAIFSIGTPLPNTDLFYRAVEKGLIDPDYWKDFVTGRRYDRAPYLVKDAEKWARKA
ncbi:MAG: radical SAM protein, partial [Deltaproteobacteria bacterium]